MSSLNNKVQLIGKVKKRKVITISMTNAEVELLLSVETTYRDRYKNLTTVKNMDYTIVVAEKFVKIVMDNIKIGTKLAVQGGLITTKKGIYVEGTDLLILKK